MTANAMLLRFLFTHDLDSSINPNTAKMALIHTRGSSQISKNPGGLG
jgi:hypothetical protein